MSRVRIVLLLSVILLAGRLEAATIVSYAFNGNGTGVVQSGFTGLVSAGAYDPRTAAIGQDSTSNTISGFSTANDNVYMRSTGTGSSSLPSSGTNAYHTFTFSITNLPAGQVLDLTNIDFRYYASSGTNYSYFFSFFSDAVGFDDLNDRLGNATLSSSAGYSLNVSIDLTSTNVVAGNTFTGLTNGTTLEFRIYFGDTIFNTNAIQRVGRYLTINGELVPEPAGIALILAGIGAILPFRRRA